MFFYIPISFKKKKKKKKKKKLTIFFINNIKYLKIGTSIQVVISLIIIYSYIYSFNVIKKTLYKTE